MTLHYMFFPANLQYIKAMISNPKLADRMLRFLLQEETTAYPAHVLSQKVFASVEEIEDHVAAINEVKARWIYEIPQPDGKESFYIIGNCKMQIKEHLRRGGFQKQMEELGVDVDAGRYIKNHFLSAPVSNRKYIWLAAGAVLIALLVYWSFFH